MFGFLKKRKNKKSNRYLNLTIKEIHKETDEAVTLVFESPEQPFDYLPGQFLTLILPIESKKVRRSYSLSSSPFLDESPAITIKRVSGGKASNYLNDHMKVGDSFQVMAPAGHFTPGLDPSNRQQYIMLAGGSGITPIMSMIKSVLKVEPQSKVCLIYQNRHKKSIIFHEALRQLVADYPDRFAVVHVLSQPEDGWQGRSGRLDASMTKVLLDELHISKPEEAQYFMCGPTGLMDSFLAGLDSCGVNHKQIHKESFFTDAAPAPTRPATDNQTHQVTILLDGEEHQVQVPPEKSILEAALDDNIDMPFSCQSGLCTACRGKVLSGEVEMSEEDGLSEEELAEGYVLNCVGHPKGEDVKIEIG